ncbi:MAG TPA: hypothetical protein VLL52_09165 [Anaerolineae bacterium]|nr:hypothetical protein [Anaerolineae bacterium]
MTATLSPTKAKPLLLAGQITTPTTITGSITLQDSDQLTTLPDHLTIEGSLIITNCPHLTALPTHLTVKREIRIVNCPHLTTINPHLQAYQLDLSQTSITTLPPHLNIKYKIDLTACHFLTHLPENLAVNVLVLRDCHSLVALPNGLNINYLDITNCYQLTNWPLFAQLHIGNFIARNCDQLTTIPPWINGLAQVDLRGCVNLSQLPDNFQVTGWIDIGQTQITSLPPNCQHAQLLWNGVRIEPRIAFQPETITIDEILNESNVERRRVLIERIGLERFLTEANVEQLYEDVDPGGQRRLLKVPIPNDEDLVALSVYCPSTGRHYLIRVPPNMETCHQAAAWIAGFDDPTLYHPLQET